MKSAAKPITSDTQTIQMLPRWVTSVQGEAIDIVAFTSGAALAMLDGVLRDPSDTLPGALLRDRMALEAAVACLKLEGRTEKPPTSATQSLWHGQGSRWGLRAICLWRGGSWRGSI